MEAHGGYSFCGLAALILMGKGHLCNTDNLLKWTANRQMRLEGGFQVQRVFHMDGLDCKELLWLLMFLVSRHFPFNSRYQKCTTHVHIFPA